MAGSRVRDNGSKLKISIKKGKGYNNKKLTSLVKKKLLHVSILIHKRFQFKMWEIVAGVLVLLIIGV